MAKEKRNSKDQHSSKNEKVPSHVSVIILSSGPVEATPETEIISVNILNLDNKLTKDVIVEIKDWTTSPPEELGKSVLLSGELLDPSDLGYERPEEEGLLSFDPTIHPSEEVDDHEVIMEPLFFQIPPQTQLTVLADFPQAQVLHSNPCYEVRISVENPINLLISSNGLDDKYIPQPGNTVLNSQFFPPLPLRLDFPRNPINKKNKN